MMSEANADYPEPEYESGYLQINTTYMPNNSGTPSNEEILEANARIAWRVREIVEARGGCVKGAVVEGVKNGAPIFYVTVSLRLRITDTDPTPLVTVTSAILEELGGEDGIPANSSIKVDTVDTSKKRDTQLPTGLQGPP
jgi:hypothetical protein